MQQLSTKVGGRNYFPLCFGLNDGISEDTDSPEVRLGANDKYLQLLPLACDGHRISNNVRSSQDVRESESSKSSTIYEHCHQPNGSISESIDSPEVRFGVDDRYRQLLPCANDELGPNNVDGISEIRNESMDFPEVRFGANDKYRKLIVGLNDDSQTGFNGVTCKGGLPRIALGYER